MWPWTVLVLSVLFTLVFGATYFEDAQSSLHGRKTALDVRARRQIGSSTPASTESSSNKMNNPKNQNQRFEEDKQDETGALYNYYNEEDITPQYNTNYYNYPPRPPPPPPPRPRSWERYYGYYRHSPPPWPPHEGRHPRHPDDFGPPHRGPPPPPYHDYRSGPPPPPPVHHRPPLPQHGSHDGHRPRPYSGSPPGGHRPPPPHGPPSGGHRPPPPHGPPPGGHRLLPPYGPPPGGHRPPPPHRPPPGGHRPPQDYSPHPSVYRPPSGQMLPFDRRGPPDNRGPCVDSGTQPEKRLTHSEEFPNLQDSSSSVQSIENAQLIKKLKLILEQPDQNDSSTRNLSSATTAGKLRHSGGEALSGLGADTNNSVATSPPPHSTLFQVVPVTPEC